MLFVAYLAKYRESVMAQAVKQLSEYGGAGGIRENEVLKLPHVELSMNGSRVRVDSITILSSKIFPAETFYGNIGQDFVNAFRKLTINFRYMYMEGELDDKTTRHQAHRE